VTTSDNLLEIKNLRTHFRTERGQVTAVDGISLAIEKGEIVGIVGESGCGKSATSQSILRLYDEKFTVKYEGEINFDGENLLGLPMSKMRAVRGNDISMIFQDPLSSLNPVYTVGDQIMESLMLHQRLSKKQALERAIEMLKLTGIPAPEKRVHEYPHELSGGMRQRVMIAIALSCQPKLLIADEPTTALDVTIQAQILNSLVELNKQTEMGILLITHDLGVVAEVCSRVIVMYLGQIVEEADVNLLFEQPLHPYTQGLIKSIPQLEGDRTQKLHMIEGKVPSLQEIPKGCRFAPRCPHADRKCKEEMPSLLSYSSNQTARCWHIDKWIQKEEVTHNASKHTV
jgi:peptide/nickel transport system ATP-binding protein